MFDIFLFSERFKKCRQSKGFTQMQLAEALNITKSAISDIERSRRSTTIEKLFEISKILDISSDYLLGLSDNPERR